MRAYYKNIVSNFINSPDNEILGKNGAVASPTKLEGGVSKNGLPAASDPAGKNKLYTTPNAKAIKNTLYMGVKKIGSDYLNGYLIGRTMELILGKKTAAKVSKYVGYYNSTSFVARPVITSAWGAVAKSAVGEAIINKSSNSTIKTGRIYYVDFASNYKVLKAA